MSNPLFSLTIVLLLISAPSSVDASYIVGGNPAGDGAYPYFASPNINDGSGTICGGTLVHSDMILTAGHCQNAWSVGETVYLGHNDIDGDDAQDTRTVAAVRVHPNYDDSSLENDVMMIHLSSSSTMPTVTLAAADGSDDPPPDCPVTAVGFGRTSTGGTVSETLLQVEMDVYSTAECDDFYGDIVEAVQICAGTSSGGRSVCNGDSGGPLFNGRGIQVGVNSFVSPNGCAPADEPAGFARVSGLRSFIDQAICDMSDSPPSSCRRRLDEFENDYQQRQRRLLALEEEYAERQTQRLFETCVGIIQNVFSSDECAAF